MPTLDHITAFFRQSFLKGKAISLRIARGDGSFVVDLTIWASMVAIVVFWWLGD